MRVPLEIIVNVLYAASEETAYFLDRETGDVLAVADPFECDQTDEELEKRIEDNQERYLALPGPETINSEKMCLQFADMEQNPDIRERLQTAAKSLYCAMRFPEEISAAGRRAEWEKFREQALTEFAREWAAEQGLELSEDPLPD